MMFLAWTPFLEPIRAFNDWWPVLAIVLAWGIGMVYKAMKMPTLEKYWRAVFIFTLQVILGMIGMTVAIAIIVQFVVPHLPVD